MSDIDAGFERQMAAESQFVPSGFEHLKKAGSKPAERLAYQLLTRLIEEFDSKAYVDQDWIRGYLDGADECLKNAE